MTITLTHFLLISALLFGFGLICVLSRRNAVAMLMGVELILNSANVNLIAFSRFSSGNIDGHVFALFGILLAAAEAAVALAIVLQIFRTYRTVDVDQATTMKG